MKSNAMVETLHAVTLSLFSRLYQISRTWLGTKTLKSVLMHSYYIHCSRWMMTAQYLNCVFTKVFRDSIK